MHISRRTLRTLPLLRDLAPTALQHLLGSAAIERCPRGTQLFEQGAYPEHLHVLMSGVVELYTTYDGRECGIMAVRPGDVFMPAAVLFHEPYLNSARTLSPSRVLKLEVTAVRDLFPSSPEFALQISRALAGHFRMAVRQILDLKCRTPAERLATFLLRLVQHGGGHAELPMPKRQLAARLGMTPETLSRALSKIADNGLVVLGHRVEVRDRQLIERFCGDSPYSPEDEETLQVHVL